MKTIKFEIPEEAGVIIVDVVLDDKIELKLALDTAATHTTIDSNILHLSGYGFENKIGAVEVETSNGVIITEVYELKNLETFGESEQNFKVQVYDFLAHGISSGYDGVLGLDFLRKRKFCLDISNGLLTLPE
ncbi:MAG: aspartyl protease family protein [Bacteroidetes bacterium]|nr:aspartyl protease family protein [Bacteroidota bacterium]